LALPQRSNFCNIPTQNDLPAHHTTGWGLCLAGGEAPRLLIDNEQRVASILRHVARTAGSSRGIVAICKQSAWWSSCCRLLLASTKSRRAVPRMLP